MSENPLMRFRIDPSIQGRVAGVSATWTRSEGRSVDHSDAARRLLLIGLAAVEKCPACSGGMRCPAHGAPDAQPATRRADDAKADGAAYTRLVALYFARYETARGVKPTFSNTDGSCLKRMIRELGEERTANAIEGAYADAFWKDKATIRSIASDPSKFFKAQSATTEPTWERGEEVRQ